MVTTAENHVSLEHLTTRPPENFKVLIVDDDGRIVEALSKILGRDGYQVFSATDAYQAWEIIMRELPDLTVMDVLLPGMDGIELCRRIKQTPETRLSMVILVTGVAERSRRLDGLSVGADDFLKKPIDPFELAVRVRTLLRTKELYDEIEAHRKDLEDRVAERTRELQEANERLQALNQVKSNILAVVSHELRTPLAKVKSGLGLAFQPGVSVEQREKVRKLIDEGLEVLEYRIADVGIFSDPPDLNYTRVVLTDLVTGAVEQARILQPDARERVKVEIPKSLPFVIVDPTALARVLAHVIDNALKFSDSKPVVIRAHLEGETVVLTVADRGVGISAAEMERLFQPLEQGDGSATRRHEGLGMGLALVRMILDAHQIPFAINSEEGAGTTVTLTLPAATPMARM